MAKAATEMTKDTRTALEAYMEHHAACVALLERISEATSNHDTAGDPDDLGWGHVGDIAETHRTLQELADRLFGEGEHAEA